VTAERRATSSYWFLHHVTASWFQQVFCPTMPTERNVKLNLMYDDKCSEPQCTYNYQFCYWKYCFSLFMLVAGSSVSTEKLCDSIWYHCVGGHKKFWGVPWPKLITFLSSEAFLACYCLKPSSVTNMNWSSCRFVGCSYRRKLDFLLVHACNKRHDIEDRVVQRPKNH